MFEWLRNRAKDKSKAQKLYGAVVTLARTPSFYSQFGFPDTPEGRFEAVALMLFMVLERLKSVPGTETLQRMTIEAFVTDMDDCMREMGVGDLVVPKRVKRAAAGFYERAGAYRPPLARKDEAALTDALKRYALARSAQPDPAPGFARLLLQFDAGLAAQQDGSILDGSALLPDKLVPAAST